MEQRSGPSGTVTLGAAETALFHELDRVFTGWARAAGAEEVILPPLLDAEAMERLDFFVNFPHLALLPAQVRRDGGTLERLASGEQAGTPGPDDLDAVGAVLPTAACYAVYLDLAGVTLPEPYLVTVRERCFRNEDSYEGLRRVLGFHMRESVCVGDLATTQGHLERFGALVESFAERLGMPLRREVATDPFFRQDTSRALMQQLYPTKQEFCFADLAIASVNLHRNFFGERCDIALAGGERAFSSCAAFGLERWVYALGERFEGDLDAAGAAVREAGAAVRAAGAPEHVAAVE